MSRQSWIGSSLLILVIVLGAIGLATWKYTSIQANAASSANQPEPMESITVAFAAEREHRQTTTSIGTMTALRSVSLQNELAGTVHKVMLTPGQIVEKGALLVRLDVSVEEAELKELEARAALAQSVLKRMETVGQNRAISQLEVDRARSEYDVALAQIERTKAIIGRKTIFAPFRSRVGLSDVHPGQYLAEGTHLTTLQGVDEAVYVDFAVPQQVAAGLSNGDLVEVFAGTETPISAKVMAVDARIDTTTRSAMVRAKIEQASRAPAPGASVRVQVPIGMPLKAVAIPVSALRKGATGEHVFLIVQEPEGKTRARMRAVKSTAMMGDDILIVSGLQAGDRVAASGSFKLREGALVIISENPEAN